MKIICTLSEYTKMARQCGENKARFNCRACPLNGVADLAEGESCDIERFVQTITVPDKTLNIDPRRKALEEHTKLHKPLADEVPEGCLHVVVPRPATGGEHLETR